MKDYILKLSQYNVWANLKFIQAMSKLDEEILNTPVDSSFENIIETCKHIWMGELGWLARMLKKGWQTTELDNFDGQSKELFNAWQLTSNAYVQLIESSDLSEKIEFLHDELNYAITKADIILTIINHGNYHRGQIVTMLRQLNITEIPKTDYIEWVRLQERKKKDLN